MTKKPDDQTLKVMDIKFKDGKVVSSTTEDLTVNEYIKKYPYAPEGILTRLRRYLLRMVKRMR
jgi:hypothetical protein